MLYATCIFYIVLSLFIVFMVKNTIGLKFYINDKRGKVINIGYVWVLLTLLFFAVFRYVFNKYGGTDAYSYVTEFQEMDDSIFDYLDIKRYIFFWKYSEPLFKMLTAAVRMITSDYHLYFLLTYGVIVSGILSFVYNFYDRESNFFTLILLFCSYLHSYNVMRGWMSIAICMFGLNAIKKKQWKKSFAIILIAVFFHYMALVFFIVWAVCWFHNKYPSFFTRNKLILAVVLVNVVSLCGRTVFFNIAMSTKYAFYRDYFTISTSIWGYLPTFFICLLAVIFFPQLKARGETPAMAAIILAVNFSLLYCIVYLPGWRIHDYFALIRMYIIAELYNLISEYFEKGFSRNAMKILVNAYVVALFVQSLLGLYESSDVFPYILNL